MQDHANISTPTISPTEFGSEQGSDSRLEVPQSTAEAENALFPLRLTAFERYLLVDERPKYPMTFVLEFFFRGPVNAALLEPAAQHALKQHPLLSARIVSQGNHSYWKEGTAHSPTIQWVTSSELNASVGTEIRLAIDPPLRIRASVIPGGLLLQVIVHHAASDGLGITDLVSELMQEYHRLSNGPSEQPAPRRKESRLAKLRGRGEFQISVPAPISRWKASRFLLSETMHFLFRRVRRLEVTPGTEDFKKRPLLVVRLPKPLQNALMDHTKTTGFSINSLILAALFQAVSDRQFTSERGRSRKWIRIVVPVNLRGRKDRKMPAANMIGYAFLDRLESDCRDSRHLMEGIATEMAEVIRWSLAACFVDSVRAVDRLPGGLHTMTRLAGNSATIVYSNLGDIKRNFRRKSQSTDRESLALDLVAGAPPVRPGTSAGLTVTRVGEETCLALTYDPRYLSSAAGGKLLCQLVACLAQLVEADLNALSLEVADGLAAAIG